MKLQFLVIHRKHDQSLEGEIEVAGATGHISLRITDAMCRKLVDVCADQLVASAKSVASDMTAELIAGTNTKALSA